MNFLNALASSGLTVGLRLSQANYLPRSHNSNTLPAPPTPAAPPAPAPEPSCARPNPKPLSPEERAAGQAEARKQLEAEGLLGRLTPGCFNSSEADAPAEGADPEEPGGGSGASNREEGPLKKLTPEEEAQVRKLAQRDQEVKAHEQAHVAAAGGLAGAPRYEYQTGPDGRSYAVGGQVSISRSGSANTEQALQEAETVKRAATAPAQPSGQDLAMAAQAENDIQRLKAEKSAETASGTAPPNSARPDQDKNPVNGAAFGSQVIEAYAAVKFGFQSAAHPLLALA